jgi:fermentation-respiration switch protein FrsA (DUF1100 family)
LEGEYGKFNSGSQPFQLLMVYDALRAFDYLKSRSDIEKGKIAVLGESMGGRNAIIAGAVEPAFKIVVGISTGGYGLPTTGNASTTRFLRSFDPDNYIQLISPRKVVIFHSENDKVQPFSQGIRTYNRAGEPKSFYRATEATHGLCGEMKPDVVREIEAAVSG